MTHIPYRSWCDVCVRARGRKRPHFRNDKSADSTVEDVARISLDYYFMNDRDRQEGPNPILIVLHESTGEKYSRAVGMKGVENDGEVDWLVKDMCEELRAWGHPGRDGNRVFLKCNGQPAMQSLKTAIGRFHGGVLIPEVSARGESQSNGAVERAAQVVAELVRVLKEQLEQNATVQVGLTDTISLWMFRWAAMLCSKYMVGSDGRTAHERRRDRRCRIPVVASGERVLYKQIREGKNRRDKLESEDRESVCFGHSRNAYQCLIGTREGVVRAYSFRRRDETSRWDARLIQGVKRTHQQLDPGRPGGRIRIRFHFEGEQADSERPRRPTRCTGDLESSPRCCTRKVPQMDVEDAGKRGVAQQDPEITQMCAEEPHR